MRKFDNLFMAPVDPEPEKPPTTESATVKKPRKKKNAK